MSNCHHHHLTLIPQGAQRLRCRHCHLTIRIDELHQGYCPECFEKSGRRLEDFDPLAPEAGSRYRCEDCGIIVDC